MVECLRCATDAHDRRSRDGRGFGRTARITSRGPARSGLLSPGRRTRSSEIANYRHRSSSALIDNGLFRLLQPRSLGGAELDPMTYVKVVEQIASHDASTGWCVEQANGCSMVCRLSRSRSRARNLRTAGRHRRLGTGRPGRVARCPRRIPFDRRLEFCQRQPSCELARRPCRDARPRWRAAVPPGWRRNSAHPTVSKEPGDDDRYLACRRSARHRQRPLFGDRPLHPRAIHCAARPRHRAARAGPALLLQHQQSLRLGRCRGGARHRARHDRRLYRTRDRKNAARRPPAAVREPGDPVATGASRGATRARLVPFC